MKTSIPIVLALVALPLLAPRAYAHCQMPCGIYGDGLRFAAMNEDVTTIVKAMNQITALSSDPAKNANQITRWVMTKETHADRIAETVTKYFLQQRIKAPPKGDAAAEKRYVGLLVRAHAILVGSMKCKQTVDPKTAEWLRGQVDDFHKEYGD